MDEGLEGMVEVKDLGMAPIEPVFKKLSKTRWLCCRPAQNAHILSCMLRFFADLRLALRHSPNFLKQVLNRHKEFVLQRLGRFQEIFFQSLINVYVIPTCFQQEGSLIEL